MPGSSIADRKLVDMDPQHGRFRVHRDSFRSEEIFQMEKELIFSKCWLYLGHESELPGKGDFLTRRVAGRDLIFVRARDGAVGAFYNTCTHRGAQVCRDRRGTTKSFSCPYHGWVYNTEGKLMSMNATRGFAPDMNADGSLNLRRVARLEQYRGFYFVNYDSNAISLSDYLAEAKGFLDLMCDQGEGEITIIPGEHAYAINANYKFLCENSYDGYHLLPTHISYLEFLDEQSKPRARTARWPSWSTSTGRRGAAAGSATATGAWSHGWLPVARWRSGSPPGVLN